MSPSAPKPGSWSWPSWPTIMFGVAVFVPLGAFAVLRADAGRDQAAPVEAAVRAGLAERLPRTKIDSVRCDQPPGLCEVVTGGTLFYTDARGQHLIIGRVYDLESRSDLTAARLLEISPEMLLAGAPRARGAEAPAAGAAEASSRIDLSALPADGAIAWGPAAGPRVAVFSDLACGYCRQLHGELRAIGARVAEHPISVLGSRRLAEFVWCAPDRAEALHAVYSGRDEVPPAFQALCDTAGLDANQEFARRVGFQGTPVLVRSDGEVLIGYRPAAELRRWLAMAGKPVGEGTSS